MGPFQRAPLCGVMELYRNDKSGHSHTVSQRQRVNGLRHIITQTPHFVLNEGGFVFVSEPICDVG
jgi:hypothetical protein